MIGGRGDEVDSNGAGGGEWWPRNRRPGEVDAGCTGEAEVEDEDEEAWVMGRYGAPGLCLCCRSAWRYAKLSLSLSLPLSFSFSQCDSVADVRWGSDGGLQTLRGRSADWQRRAAWAPARKDRRPRALGSEERPAWWCRVGQA